MVEQVVRQPNFQELSDIGHREKRLTQGTQIPDNSIVMGVPGKVVKTRDNFERTRLNALVYLWNARAYAKGDHRAGADPAFKEFLTREMAKAIDES